MQIIEAWNCAATKSHRINGTPLSILEFHLRVSSLDLWLGAGCWVLAFFIPFACLEYISLARGWMRNEPTPRFNATFLIANILFEKNSFNKSPLFRVLCFGHSHSHLILRLFQAFIKNFYCPFSPTLYITFSTLFYGKSSDEVILM